MRLLKWKELARSKSELGDKINTVRNAIIQHDIGQKTSQASFSKVFQPITTKLDDIITSNLKMPITKRRALKKAIDDLFDEKVLPKQEKQLVPKPPTYEESLKDLLQGKKQC